MSRKLARSLLVVVAALLGSPLLAQNVTVALRGDVSDEQGGALPGATVTARNVETNVSRSVVTGGRGHYFIPNLPPGRYDLTAGLSGFSTERRAGLLLRVGQEGTIDFALKVGGLTEQVTVVDEAPLLETTRNTVGTIIDKDQIDRLPVIDRNFASLARLSPGVTIGTGARGESISANGQRGFANSFFVDGATADWQYYGSQSSTFVQDWIQEFQVMTNSYPAEFGTASGGIINAITRSGGNELHGRVYGFFRDKALDAAPFAGTFDESEKPEFLDTPPSLSQQRLGAFLGGPILKDKLFLFAGYEHFQRDSSVVLAITDYWRARGLAGTLPTKGRDDPFMLKLDANLNQRNHVSLRFDRADRTDTNQSQLDDFLDTEENRYTYGGPVWNLVGNWTSTISNTKFNELRAVYGSNKQFIVCNKSGTGGGANLELGPPGTFSRQVYAGAVFGCPFFSGLEGEETLQLIDNFSWASGRHQWKAGGQAYQVRTVLDRTNGHDGTWYMSGVDRVFDIEDPATYPQAFYGAIGQAPVRSHRWNTYFYLQDTWQVGERLTLNLGLRYDYDSTVQAGNEFIDEKNAQLVDRYGGAPPLEKVRVDSNNLAPRLGAVWTPGGSKRTTLRAAAGRFYDQNHVSFNAISYMVTLLADRFLYFDAANPLSWATFGSPEGLRSFLAQRFPLFPDLSQAQVPPETIAWIDPGLKTAHTDQLTAGVSHEFGRGFSLEADYVLAKGRDIPAFRLGNVALVNGEYIVPDPRFTTIFTMVNAGSSTYHALLVQARYRTRKGAAQASYTLSRATANTSMDIFVFGLLTNPLDISEDQGFDSADRRHNLVVSGDYTFPWDIQLSGIFAYRSAPPYSATTFQQLDSDPFLDRPEPRNSRRADSFKTVDIRATKTVKLGGRARAAVFWEVYNLFNADNFTSYVENLDSPLFGLPTTAFEKRRQQGGIRIDF